MNNIPKRQHTVQKRLLSNFTSTPQNAYDTQRIWWFNKETRQSKEISLKIAGVRSKYLNPKADKIITQLERECYPTIDRIIENECMFRKGASETEKTLELGISWFSLYRYISAQLQRTELLRDEIKKQIILTKPQLRDFHSAVFRPAKALYFIDLGFGRTVKMPEVSKTFYSLILIRSSVSPLLADSLAITVAAISYPVIMINDSPISYIQNDIGLAPFDPLFPPTSMTHFADKAALKCILSFPISPRICIDLCTNESLRDWARNIPANSGRGTMFKTDEQTRRLTNEQMFKSAKKNLYSNRELKYGNG